MNETTPITPPPTEAAGTPSADEKLWALFAHLSILVGGAITGGWAFSIGCFLGPLQKINEALVNIEQRPWGALDLMDQARPKRLHGIHQTR